MQNMKIEERGNVLVIGNSGVGKSTLINAVLGEDRAMTGYGSKGTTNELEVYESEMLPFRVIDTIGFEPTFLQEQKAIFAVKKWSHDSAKEGKHDNQINVIWFCVDGASRKVFPKAIESMLRATAMWKSVPIIVVITKSYSAKERKENIKMVEEVFASQKRYAKNLKKVIPVVAATYELDDTAFAPPIGLTELIDATNELMPEGLQAGLQDLASFKLNRKRMLAHGLVGMATVSGTVVGAIPIPVADGAILTPLEMAEVLGIAKIYGIKEDDKAKKFFDELIKAGTVSVAAKTTISMLKAIPGINIAASVLNAVIAGCFVAGLGESTIYACEQVYLGYKTLEEADWAVKLLESKFSNELIEQAKTVLSSITENTDLKAIPDLITTIFAANKKK